MSGLRNFIFSEALVKVSSRTGSPSFVASVESLLAAFVIASGLDVYTPLNKFHTVEIYCNGGLVERWQNTGVASTVALQSLFYRRTGKMYDSATLERYARSPMGVYWYLCCIDNGISTE